MRATRPLCLSAVLVSVLAACSGGGGDDGTGPTPSFTMSVSPGTLSLEAGTPFVASSAVSGGEGSAAEIAAAVSGNITVSVVRSGGFAGPVTVTVEGLPTGVSAPSATIGAEATSAQLTVTASTAAAAGSSTLTIRGSGSGVTARTATIQLTITVPPSIGISLSQGAISIEQGQSGQVTANLARNGGFTGSITLSASGNPALMSVQFNPSPATGATSAITIGVGPGVATGTYQVTIQASGTGVANAGAVLAVTVTPAVTPGVSIAASPNAISVQQGQSGNTTLNLTRTNFTGTVNLTSSGAPAGMVVSFNPAAATGNTSTVTVAVGAGVAPGNYVITMTGTASGIPTANNDLTVTVTATPAIALALNPAALSIQQGQNANTALTITRTNFTGTVNLTSTGAPANVSVAFNPAGTTGTASTVTVAVGAGVAPGVYPITVRGNGTGLAEATTNLQLTVTAGGGGGNVTFTFCAQSGIPLWLAFKNLGGSWTQVAGVGGVFTFTINPRGVVAWVMQDGAKTNMQVVYGSTSELGAQGATFCRGNGSVKTITGTATSIPGGDIASLYMGGGAAATLFAPGPFQLDGVPDGLQDLVGVRSTIAALPLVNRITFLRDLNLANNADVGTFDLESGVAPAIQTATINNLGADQQVFASIFMSKNGTSAPIFTSLPDVVASQPWRGVPSGSTVAGDLQMQNIIATPNGSATGFPFRSVIQFHRNPADRTYTLPPYLNDPPTITLTGTSPYVTFTSTWTIQSADFNQFWSLMLSPASGSVSFVRISGASGYFGGGPVQLDLEAFGAGFNSAWGLQPGIMLNWNFLAAGGSATIAEGAVGTSGGLAGAFVP